MQGNPSVTGNEVKQISVHADNDTHHLLLCTLPLILCFASIVPLAILLRKSLTSLDLPFPIV